MSKKSDKIAALIAGCQDRDQDAHYLGYFECFNRGLFYVSPRCPGRAFGFPIDKARTVLSTKD